MSSGRGRARHVRSAPRHLHAHLARVHHHEPELAARLARVAAAQQEPEVLARQVGRRRIRMRRREERARLLLQVGQRPALLVGEAALLLLHHLFHAADDLVEHAKLAVLEPIAARAVRLDVLKELLRAHELVHPVDEQPGRPIQLAHGQPAVRQIDVLHRQCADDQIFLSRHDQ